MSSVTLKDVAEYVGVDVSTVSRALSDDRSNLVNAETKFRVIQAAEKLGYRGNIQASALRSGKTQTIGVIVADLSNPFIGPVLRGIAQGLDGPKLLPIMAESRDSSDSLNKVCELLLAQRVDGVICTAGRAGDRSTLTRLASETPTVLAVRQWPNSKIASVSHDDIEGGRLAANHLLGLGHVKLGQLMGPQDIGSFKGRSQGFSEAVAAAGAECVAIDDAIRLPTLEAGRQLMAALLERSASPPTAIFAQNDTLAIGAMHVAREQGLRCPEDISIVGYNDVPLTAFLTPALTTIKLPGYEVGRVAADLVVSIISEPEQSKRTITLAPELVARESTAVISAGSTPTSR